MVNILETMVGYISTDTHLVKAAVIPSVYPVSVFAAVISGVRLILEKMNLYPCMLGVCGCVLGVGGGGW